MNAATLVRNCGAIITGDIRCPVISGNSVVVQDGRIVAIGHDLDAGAVTGAVNMLDAKGHILIPGLIDSHVHPSWGDWSSRTGTAGWLEAYRQAGVTTAISQGAFNIDAYPEDRAGMIALGTILARADRGPRHGGVKLSSATVSLVEEFDANDFALLAGAGVSLISEIGVRGCSDPPRVRALLKLAHAAGFVSRVHVGPGSVRGSTTITVPMALAMEANIAAHINGGPNAPEIRDIDRLICEASGGLELCYSGNLRAFIHSARRAREEGATARLMCGSDTPSGSGVTPRAMLRMCAWLSSLVEFSPAEAIAVATGNAAEAYRLQRGKIEVGREADLLLIGAPRGTSWADGLETLAGGDIPAVSMVMVDGEILSLPGRNTPYAREALDAPARVR